MSQITGTNVDFTAIIRQMQQQEAARREDALARYAQANTLAQQLTQQVGAMGTYGAAESQLDMVGDAARSRIMQGADQQFAQADQDLTTRGLGNTTIRSSVQRGIGLDEQRAINELDEGIAQQRSGLLERRADTEMRAGVNEIDTLLSRVDEPIDYGLMAGLLQQAAATPQGKQKISIGPGSSSYGSQFRATSGGSGGGGSGRTGVQTYYGGSGLSSFTDAAGSQGTSGVQTFSNRATPQPQQRSYSSTSSPSGQNRESSRSGMGMSSYYGGQAGNSAQGVLGGYAFGPGIMEGTTYQGKTGSGMPLFQTPSGSITNDPSGEGASSVMEAGSGLISGPGGVYGIGPGEDQVTDFNTGQPAVQPGVSGGDEPEPDKPQTYYRPGLLGWQGVNNGREFASSSEAIAAGYGYIRQGGEYVSISN